MENLVNPFQFPEIYLEIGQNTFSVCAIIKLGCQISRIVRLSPSNTDHIEVINRTKTSPMRFVFALLVERKLLFVYIVLGIIIHQSMRFVSAPLIGNLVEFGIERGDLDQVKFYAILVVIVAVVSAFFDTTMSWANEIVANDVEYHTRGIYFNSIQEKSQSFHDSAKIGEMMAVAQNDMRSLYSMIAPGLRIAGESFVSFATITIIIFLESYILGIVFLILFPFWLFSLRIYAKRLTPVAISQQNDFRSLSAEVQENLAAAEVVRAFSQEKKEISLFKNFNQQYTQSWENRGKVGALYFPLLATYFTGGIIFLVGAYLAINPVITLGNWTIEQDFGLAGMVTISVLIVQLRGPSMQMNFILEFWSLGLAGIRKIQETLAIDDSLEVQANPVEQEIQGKVEFNNVSFSYNQNGTKIIDNVSFTASKGDIIALVGATGSGKTTLLKLITRLYEVTEGEILIDGTNVNAYDPEKLSQSIGVVEQDVFLFSTSIRENIVFAMDEFSDEDLATVVKLSRINEFLDDLPEGLDTVVGERGVRLSGGQKQRVAIARAFLVDPQILILDDATSAIDGKTEEEIVSALKSLMAGRTTFLITNRLNMIRQANRVLVLEDGKISGEGTHKDLLRSNNVYRRIFDPHMELPEMEGN